LSAIVRWALEGNHAALDQLLAVARPVAARYCRARIGRHGGSYVFADRLARDACQAALAALPTWPDRHASFLAVVYQAAAAEADRCPPAATATGDTGRMAALLAALPTRQRETLVLRVAVGMSVEQTALALGWRTRVVRDVEREALTNLRALLPSR
jgi:RNA polymerase sigma-70 factor (ECF subfamily)